MLVPKTLNAVKTLQSPAFVVQARASDGGTVRAAVSPTILVKAERFVLVIAVKIKILIFQFIVAVIEIASKRKNVNRVNASLLHDQLSLTIPMNFKSAFISIQALLLLLEAQLAL